MNIGFIGTGKIASSVISGISSSKKKYKKIIISPRNKVLVNFERVSVPAKTTVQHEFILTRNNFKYVNSKGEYIFEPGEFIIDISGSKENISLE